MVLPSRSSLPRTRRLSLARNGLLLVLAVCTLSALVEHGLERRDAARLTASETFYNAQGRRIRYHLTGAGAPGPTLILLNGGHASLEQWHDVQTALSAVAPVVSYDRCGTGFNDPADGHDAIANAAELDHLLHSAGIAGPLVLVSFSAGSMTATLFAAQHLDVVKGIVLVDPILSAAPGTHSWRRQLWRVNPMSPVEAFFGYTRLKLYLQARKVPPGSPESERSQAILTRTNHWVASARESLDFDASARETEAVMVTRPFADLPFAVLISSDPAKSLYFRDIFDRQTQLAASSRRSLVRALHVNHSEVLNDPAAIGAVVDLTRTIAEAVRARESDAG